MLYDTLLLYFDIWLILTSLAVRIIIALNPVMLFHIYIFTNTGSCSEICSTYDYLSYKFTVLLKICSSLITTSTIKTFIESFENFPFFCFYFFLLTVSKTIRTRLEFVIIALSSSLLRTSQKFYLCAQWCQSRYKVSKNAVAQRKKIGV